MNVVSTRDIPPLTLGAGDTLSVKYTDPTGEVHTLDSMKINEGQVVDRISFVTLEDELGFESGLGALFGKKK